MEHAPNGIPDKLDDYQLVVINNWDMEIDPAPRKAALEDFVKKGGGLFWIAGEHNVYVEKKDQPEDAAGAHAARPSWRRRARPKARPWC